MWKQPTLCLTNMADTQSSRKTLLTTSADSHRGGRLTPELTPTVIFTDAKSDSDSSRSPGRDPSLAEPEMGSSRWLDPQPDGTESSATEPIELQGGAGGGGGSRLKNRTGPSGGVVNSNPHNLLTIMEDEVNDLGQQTPASRPSLSRSSSYSAYVSSSVGTTPVSSGPPRKDLSVKGTWKVETVMKKRQNKKSSKTSGLAVVRLKWVVTVVMATVFLACLVAVKLSVLLLSTQLWDAQIHTSANEAEWRHYSAHFILLYIYLSVPPLVMLMRAVWYGLLDKTVPWPGKKAVFCAVLSATLESLGLCLMCYYVLGKYDGTLSVLLLATPLMLPAFNTIAIAKDFRSQGRVKSCTVPFVAVGALCLTTGLILVGLVIARTDDLTVEVWHVLVALLSLSVAWLPWLQSYISTTVTVIDTNKTVRDETIETYTHNTFNNEETSHIDTNTHNGHLGSNAAWRTSVIVNVCRLLFIFIFSCLFFILDSGQPHLVNVLTNETHQAFLDSWDLPANIQNTSTWVAFGLGQGAGALAYGLAFAACHMNMAVGALAPPLLLATPVSLIAVAVRPVCESFLTEGTCRWRDVQHVTIPAAVVLFLGHLLAFGWYLFRVDSMLLQQEHLVFCVPGYNGVALDAWLTINRRRDVSRSKSKDKEKKKKKVYICTTMYREKEEEMRQLLESIRLINEAQATGGRSFESHIIFDNGVRNNELSQFALTLIAVLDETLDVKQNACTKSVMPYGLKLHWLLPGDSGQRMSFDIHLKDNLLVKNKKRWSQVMYMSYVLDFLAKDAEDAFILTTDADVMFTPDSVEALLDLITRDRSVGAVCARTHPIGDGPLVWYQVFEYAIGHWFQKAAEHVLGSVLCAPGCFSVYRCRALQDVLPQYARRVESAFDFLTKDMGEDRWLCTLLVQSGWRIEYCAASENWTNCPSDFEEFYKQRRRWIVSTLANLMLIIKEWKYVHLLNHRVSVVFILYQGLLLFSTLIGPSTVMLVVSGGLTYAWEMDPVTTLILQMVACTAFAWLCMLTIQPTQLKVAKMYTFLYAVVMTAVVVGTAEQIVIDINTPEPRSSGVNPSNGSSTTTPSILNQHMSVDLPVSVTTLYFGILVSIFLVTGLLHPREMHCLLHGLWFLLSLPSSYLVLTIYSICNITDSSWGTREQTADKTSVMQTSWQKRVQDIISGIFFCCSRQRQSGTTVETPVQTVMTRTSSLTLSEDRPLSPWAYEDVSTVPASADAESQDKGDTEIPDETGPVLVEDWLPTKMMRDRYARLFKKHGFESTLFIAGMTETELRHIGVTSQGHLHCLLAQIALIPAFEIEYKVPTNVDEWLEEIGLYKYRDNFRRNHIQQPKEMGILKSFRRKDIEQDLKIFKYGHIKRLKYAISMLKIPTKAQQKAIRMRQMMAEVPTHKQAESNVEENNFWDTLKKECLQPDLEAFGPGGEVKVQLTSLRNDWLMILAVSNTLWLILITTLASSTDLTVLGANPVGLVFLVVFGFLFVVQFFTMLLHRLYTLSHYLARAPYRSDRNRKYKRSSSGDVHDTSDRVTTQIREGEKRAWDKALTSKRKSRWNRAKGVDTTQTAPLVPGLSSVQGHENCVMPYSLTGE